MTVPRRAATGARRPSSDPDHHVHHVRSREPRTEERPRRVQGRVGVMPCQVCGRIPTVGPRRQHGRRALCGAGRATERGQRISANKHDGRSDGGYPTGGGERCRPRTARLPGAIRAAGQCAHGGSGQSGACPGPGGQGRHRRRILGAGRSSADRDVGGVRDGEALGRERRGRRRYRASVSLQYRIRSLSIGTTINSDRARPE